MVSEVKFSRHFNILNEMMNYKGIYAIESEVQRGVVYGISDGKFAIVNGHGATFCPFHETPILAMRQPEKMREEILEVYEEVKELKQWGYLIS